MLDNREYIKNEIREIIIRQILKNGIEYQDKIEDILNYVAKEVSSEDFQKQIKYTLAIGNPLITEMKKDFRNRDKEFMKKMIMDFAYGDHADFEF